MKKLSILFAALLCTVLLPITAQAKNKTVTIDSFEASVSEARFSGTSDAAAIMVQVRDENGRILALSTFPVLDGAFDGSIEALSLTEGKTVKLYAADYEGGSFAKDTATVQRELSEDSQIRAFLEDLYRYILLRDSDADGRNYWLTGLEDHRMDGANTILGFLQSDEYLSRAELTDEQFVLMLYKAILGREPDADGRSYWLDQLKGKKTRSEIVAGFVNSVEFVERCRELGILPGEMKEDGSAYPAGTRYLVERFYRGALGREGDEEGLVYWTDEANKKNQTIRDIAFRFLASEEFQSHEYSDADYIRALYRMILGRDPENAEVESWLATMKEEKLSTGDLPDGFLYSPEFRKTCEELGVRF